MATGTWTLWAERRRFSLLLATLFLVQLMPVLRGGPNDQLATAMWGLVLVAAVHAVASTRRITVMFVVLAIFSFGGRVFSAFIPMSVLVDRVDAGSYVAGIVFLGGTAFVVMRAVLRANRIDGDNIMGAISVYVMIGYLWAAIYALVHLVEPGSFNFPASAAEDLNSSSPEVAFGYYSFVTLTTLGYGDITPISYRARTLSWMEAVVGVTFMATTIAFLVSQVVVDRQEKRD